MERPLALVTNDDGIDSLFLHGLVDALAEEFEVLVAAPKREQSWSGRSFTRRGDIEVSKRTDLRWTAWSIDGTPSDCVNLGCGNLVERTPDVVVSGLNVGFNVSLPLILASGTVAAALEGAMWDIPSIAASIALPNDHFNAVRAGNVPADGPVARTLKNAAAMTASFAQSIVGSKDEGVSVHNLNFPFEVEMDTPVEQTHLARLKLGGFFEEHSPGSYRFRFPHGRPRPDEDSGSDYNCIGDRRVSHTVLEFARIA
jgi:5'-nucleotidase